MTTLMLSLQKLRDRLSRVRLRTWLTVGLSLAALDYLVVMSVAAYPDFSGVNIVYPWVANIGLIELISFIACIVFLIALFVSVRKPLIIGIILTGCTISCCASSLDHIFGRHLVDKDSLEYAGNTYHLVFIYGNGAEPEDWAARYEVYKCESMGIICHSYFYPDILAVGHDEVDSAFRAEARFIVDSTDGNLYILVMSEKHRVYYNQYGLEPKLP